MEDDGTTLIGKSCGPNINSNIATSEGMLFGSSSPAAMRSKSNVVNIMFSSDGGIAWPGWSLSWSAVTQGE